MRFINKITATTTTTKKIVKNEINEFVTNLRNHFSEEEQIVFPLALKADLS